MIIRSKLGRIWFTASSMLKWPERTTNYLINRAGDSNIYNLVICYSFIFTVEIFFTSKETVLHNLLWSPILLGFTFVATIFLVKVQSFIFTSVSSFYGGAGNAFISSLVIYWIFLPLAILFSLLKTIITIINLDAGHWIEITSLITCGYFLIRCTIISDSVNFNKSFFIVLTYCIVPVLLLLGWFYIIK